MTDDVVKNDDTEEAEVEGVIPDFIPNTPAPIGEDDLLEDDPHTSFDQPVVAAEGFTDLYGVGAPKVGHDDYDDEEDEDELAEGFDTNDSEAY
jgi:hypothetical protein